MRRYQVWEWCRYADDCETLAVEGQVLGEDTLRRHYPWMAALLPAGAGLQVLELVTDCRHLAMRQAGAAPADRRATLLALLAEAQPERIAARRWCSVYEERQGVATSDGVCREGEVPEAIRRLVPRLATGGVLRRLRVVADGWRLDVRLALEVTPVDEAVRVPGEQVAQQAGVELAALAH